VQLVLVAACASVVILGARHLLGRAGALAAATVIGAGLTWWELSRGSSDLPHSVNIASATLSVLSVFLASEIMSHRHVRGILRIPVALMAFLMTLVVTNNLGYVVLVLLDSL
jgi:hypothetical protein